MEHNLPASLIVDALSWPGLDVVAHNLEVVGLGLTEQVLQQRADNRLHATAQHDDRYVVGLGPEVELLEVGVELDVLEQQVDALVVRQLDAVHHFLERVAELAEPVEHVLIALLAQGGAEADVVGHEVIAVLERHGSIPIGLFLI